MADPANVNLDEIHAFAIQLGKDAGSMLYQAAQKRFTGGTQTDHVEKESAVDVVTQTDEGERTIVDLPVSGAWADLSAMQMSRLLSGNGY